MRHSASRHYPNSGGRVHLAPAARNAAIRGIFERVQNAPAPLYGIEQEVNTPAGWLPVAELTHSTFRGWLYSFYVERCEPVVVNGVAFHGTLAFSGRMAWSETELLPLQSVQVLPVPVLMLPAPKGVVAAVKAKYQCPAGNQLAWFMNGAIS